jgi:hypothetical protein
MQQAHDGSGIGLHCRHRFHAWQGGGRLSGSLFLRSTKPSERFTPGIPRPTQRRPLAIAETCATQVADGKKTLVADGVPEQCAGNGDGSLWTNECEIKALKRLQQHMPS